MRCRRELVLVASLLFAAPVGAAVLHVNPDAPGPAHDGTSWAAAFRSIQPALDAARHGDEVRVTGGTFRENLSFLGPGVILRGGYAGTETGPDAPPAGTETTILGFEPETPVVFFPPEAAGGAIRGVTVRREMPGLDAGIRVETTGVLIEGVTVRGIGQPGGWGGGIAFLAGSGGTVRDCLLEGNASREGGGIQIMMSDVTIELCTIRRNASEDTTPPQSGFPTFGRGGGIWANRSTVRIRWNTISGNRAWGGGGLYLLYCYPRLANNTIRDNIARAPAASRLSEAVPAIGGGIQAYGVEGDFRNNVIAGNIAVVAPGGSHSWGARGGGAALENCLADVVNNTFAENVSHTEEGEGTLAGLSGNPDGVVSNNIFAGNRSDQGPAASVFGTTGGRNLWWANTPADPVERMPGTIVAPPGLTASFHLSPGSLAIDRGVSAFVGANDVDIDGEPRIRGRRVDLGADEAPAVPGVPIAYVSPAGSDANDGSGWETAKRTIHAALDAVALDGEVWVAEGVYRGGVGLTDSISLYGGFLGHESTRESRSPRQRQTVLEGGGPVVSIPASAEGVTLDGFTIRDGYAMSGAGIRSGGRNVMLSNNVIENNVAEGFGFWSYVSGGGVTLRGGPVYVLNNSILNNKALITYYCAPVGGIFSAWLPGPRFGPTEAEGNPYEEYPVLTGGGIEARDAEVLIANNLFTGNSSGSSGSALTAWASSGFIVNNTFADNVLPGIDPRYVPYAAEAVNIRECAAGLVFANNIVAFNPAGLVLRQSDVVPRSNAFFANARGHAFGAPDSVSLEGNLVADPVFVDRAGGDYRLSVGSPLIDRGDGSVVETGWTDLDGHPRILGAGVDIGAYEFVPSAGLTLGHAAWALRVAAGLTWADAPALSALDAAGPDGRIDIRDAVSLARSILRTH